jgi:histidinol-phosphate aminotransferase
MKNLKHLVRPNIWSLQPYASARHEFEGQAEVYLDANENPYDTGFNRYPDPLQWELKLTIAKEKKVAPENIFLGNGSDEAIDLLFRIFCEPGKDNAVILPPTYGMYKVSADICNVQLKEIPLSTDYQPKVEEILQAVDEQSKLLFLCTPNNPTGNCFEENAMRQLLEQFQGIVVVDEAYIDFADRISANQWLTEYPNLVVMQTFSKAWGLAGIRLGMAFASEEIIGLFNKVKPPYNVNQLTQEKALEALANARQTKAWIQMILEQRAYLENELKSFSFVEQIYPSEANFILVKVNAPLDLYKYLVDRKIIVRNRSKVLLCEGSLRITVGTEEENQRLLEALKEY